jgi:hypothetical protein
LQRSQKNIRSNIKLIEFWSRQRQIDNLTEEIIRFLDESKLIEPYQRQNAVADRLSSLARRLHPWLTA